jgi:hypothetical protein
MRILGDAKSDDDTGPLPKTGKIRTDDPTVRQVDLPLPVGARGAVSFWLLLEQPLRNGPDGEAGERIFCELPGLATCRLGWRSSHVGLRFDFAPCNGPKLELQTPGLPGPQWLHICFTWDAADGLLQGYINGSPTRMPGTRLPAWTVSEAPRLAVHAGEWPVAEMRIFDRVVEHAEAEAMVPPLYRGSLDSLLGQQARGEFQPGPPDSTPTYTNDFTGADAIAGWHMEGGGTATCDDGWLWLRPQPASEDSADGAGDFVFWCDADVPDDFLLTFEAQILSEHGLCITFFCAAGNFGEDVLDPSLAPRNGGFGQYTNGDIDCYHVSWHANTPRVPGRGTSNLRKNAGFFLVDQGPPGVPAGSEQVHQVAICKRGQTIEVGVDGRRLIRWSDDAEYYGPVLGAGRIGFRQMRWTHARYRALRVCAL